MLTQWRNDAPGAPATPGGAVLGGRQIVIKMWDNFARLTALLAKVCVWFNNLTIYLDFSAIFSQIAPSKPLNQGRHWGATFCRRGAPFRRGLKRYATVLTTSLLRVGGKSLQIPRAYRHVCSVYHKLRY